MTRPRRVPRQERAAHQIAAGARPRFDLSRQPTSSARPRRDLRGEAAALRVPGGARLRLDRTQSAASTARAPVEAAAAPAVPVVRVVDDPAFLVAVVADAPSGRLSAGDRQCVGAARLLADAGGGAVVLVAPPLAEAAGEAGADRVVCLPAAVGYDPDGQAAAVAAALGALRPRHAIFPETPRGGDLARRVAVLGGEGLFAGVEQVGPRAVVRPARGRLVEQRCAPPALMTLAADAAAPHAGPPHEGRPVELPAPPLRASGILGAEDVPAEAGSMPLAEADFVTAAGNGVTDLETFRTLVAALGATPGASRVLCDAGLMPRAAQVGASGTVLEATCYLALGIAGAPQHLQGVARCEHVVAVNTDLHAAMIERAGLAIVQDAQAVMPALLAALAEERA